jgi:K+-sensing histidine kinase KdpD
VNNCDVNAPDESIVVENYEPELEIQTVSPSDLSASNFAKTAGITLIVVSAVMAIEHQIAGYLCLLLIFLLAVILVPKRTYNWKSKITVFMSGVSASFFNFIVLMNIF